MVSGILDTITQYGRHIVAIPDAGFNMVDRYDLSDNSGWVYPNSANYALDVPLWTSEEGRSDLMLQVRVANGNVKIEGLGVP